LSALTEKEFTELTLLVLEMLKRGAGTVDVHPMNVCIRVVDGAWSVGKIPRHRVAEHCDSLLPQEWIAAEEQPKAPIDGDEVIDESQTSGVGTAQ
jgi:hypothetical protein